MLTLTFADNMKPEVQAEIDRYVRPFLWLVPTWCHDLTINVYTSSDDNAAIKTGIHYEYRNASLDFYSVWFICSRREKQLHVIHDLLHVANSVYVDWAEDNIRYFCPKDDDKAMHKRLMEDSRERCESITQDLAKAIYSKFGGEHDAV